jgi:hypothetical protein
MTSTVSESAIRKHFPAFARKLKSKAVCVIKSRLAQGAKEYGDVSFSRDLCGLFNEIGQELIDVPGWGFIAWCRLLSQKTLATGEAKKQIESYQRELENIANESLKLYRRVENLRESVALWETQLPEEPCPQK